MGSLLQLLFKKNPKQQYIKGSLPNLICRGLEEEIQLYHSVSTDVLCLVKCRHSSMLSAFARLRPCISSDTEMEMPPCLRNTTYIKQQVSLFHPLPKPTSTRFARSKAQKLKKLKKLKRFCNHLLNIWCQDAGSTAASAAFYQQKGRGIMQTRRCVSTTNQSKNLHL